MSRKKRVAEEISLPVNFNIHGYIADTQGCGHIRIIIPYMLLNQYRTEYLSFSAFYNPNFITTPDFYKKQTFVVFQRSVTEVHLDMFKYFSENIKVKTNTPIIYEIDDLLIDIDKTNYAHDYYVKYKDIIPKIMRLADGVVVSTKRLKQVYSKYNSNIQISQNRLPKFLWGEPIPNYTKEIKRDKPRILWAGSANHFTLKKLEEEKGIKGGDFGEKLLDFIRRTSNIYQWVFLGAIPNELEDLKDITIEYHKWRNIFEYPHFIKSLDIDFAVAPLKKGLFNNCKSNIKLLEYVASGYPGIYSNSEPYKDAMVTCDNDDEMIFFIEKMAADLDFRKEVYDHDYNMVREDLFWEENNNLIKFINSHLLLFDRYIKI
jgi:hypothetical protein